MKNCLILLVFMALTSVAAEVQSYHPPVYLTGGIWPTTSPSTYPTGIIQYDGTVSPPVLTTVFSHLPYRVYPNSLCMDWDNKHVLIQTEGTLSTLYPGGAILRCDLQTNTFTTVFHIPPIQSGPYSYYGYALPGCHVDQNGDYLFSYWWVNSHVVMRCNSTTLTLTTVLKESALPRNACFGRHGRDIDTGRAMFMDMYSRTAPPAVQYPILTLNPEDGYNPNNVGSYNDGSTCGWKKDISLEQNHRNGYVEAPTRFCNEVWQLKPGSANLTTIKSVPMPSMPYFPCWSNVGGIFDLQTAARPRYLCDLMWGPLPGPYKDALLLHYDTRTWNLITFETLISTVQYKGTAINQFTFKGGRHIQTMRIRKNVWDILLSVPHLPKHQYVVAAGASGIRPGIRLPDGRNININLDPVVFMTFNNALAPIWRGDTVSTADFLLDANGESRGRLDLSSVLTAPLGIPIWIVMAVLDTKAPLGIAYLPDTYVMRI